MYKKLLDFYNFTEDGLFANLNNFTMLPLTGYSQNVALNFSFVEYFFSLQMKVYAGE